MQIDWLTVTAQLLNFLILVWLLQHFLYGPITRAMAAREARIEARLDEARKAREEAEAEAKRFREQQRELERDRERLRREAREAADEERRELEEKARQTVDRLEHDWRRQLRDEREDFLRDLRTRAGDLVYRIAARALEDLGDADLQERIAQAFGRRLRDLDDEARERLAQAAGNVNEGGIRIVSRFPLSSEAKRVVTRAVHEVVAPEVEVDYADRPGASLGIELACGSQRVIWTIAGYLDDLERTVDERLRRAGAEDPEEHAA
jgi:F-type H+-transporting ATPase subunit b